MSYHQHIWSIVRKGVKQYRHPLTTAHFTSGKDALNDFEAQLASAPEGWRKALKRAEGLREGNAYVSSYWKAKQ